MLNRSKVRKYLKIRWDISFRRKFAIKSEDEQLELLIKNHMEEMLFYRQKKAEESIKFWFELFQKPEYKTLRIDIRERSIPIISRNK